MNTTTRTYRPGQRMIWALRVLAANGGEMYGKWNLARAVGPHGSNSFGDRIVRRCVARGYIALTGSGNGGRNGGYTMRLTDAGRSVLAAA